VLNSVKKLKPNKNFFIVKAEVLDQGYIGVGGIEGFFNAEIAPNETE